MYSFWNNDTICAVSTPSGVGGIAVVRISGKDAISIADSIWRGKRLNEAKNHTAHLGDIIDPAQESSMLDTAVATIYRAPRSFTGEDVVELSVHGSMWIQRELIHLLIRQGCRVAEAGEFTRRAFANGRLDLAQAEAVADIIAASSKSAHRLASMQIKGEFSNKITLLRDKLIEMASLLELELDFSEEEVEFASRDHLLTLAGELQEYISRLAASYSTGSVIKDGIPVAIVGEPNVGKSTLLNALLGDDRAIVSNMPGTTRDTIEDTMEIDGVLYRFIDTAGIRETDDTIESLGIERSFSAIKKARIVLLLTAPDLNRSQIEEFKAIITPHLSQGSSLLVIKNKIDTLTPLIAEEGDNEIIGISAAKGINLDRLKAALYHLSGVGNYEENEIIVTNARHYEALVKATGSIERVIEGISNSLSGDFIAQDLRETIHHLSAITGEITTSDLLATIFSRFCIGK